MKVDSLRVKQTHWWRLKYRKRKKNKEWKGIHAWTSLKKKNLLTHTIWDSLGWGGCLETDMNGTSDQMVHQTIRIFGLRCDMYYVWSPAPTHPPAQSQTQTHPQNPSSDLGKKSDRWVYWKDPLRRPKHTKALSVWRLDLEGNGNQRKTGQREMDICGICLISSLVGHFVSWMSTESFGSYSI